METMGPLGVLEQGVLFGIGEIEQKPTGHAEFRPKAYHLGVKESEFRTWGLGIGFKGCGLRECLGASWGSMVLVLMWCTNGDKVFELPSFLAQVEIHPQHEMPRDKYAVNWIPPGLSLDASTVDFNCALQLKMHG